MKSDEKLEKCEKGGLKIREGNELAGNKRLINKKITKINK